MAFAAATLSACGASASAIQPADFPALAFEQKPGAEIAREATVRTESGVPARLGDLVGSRPAILVLEYLRCPNLCGLVLGGLVDGLAGAALAGGRDYDVLAISIDPRETPADAVEARRLYGQRSGAAALAGWRFLTAGEPEIRRIADAVGFPMRWDASIGQYAHPAGIVVTTPEGRVSRYLFGVDYRPLDLELAVAEASEGRIASMASRLLLLCYGYDPTSGSYSPSIIVVLRAAGLLTVSLGALFLVTQFRRESRG